MGIERALATKAAVISVLGAAAAGRWQTVGYRGQSIAAERALNDLRRVVVYYVAGTFPESRSSRVTGPFRHDVTLKVGLMVAADAKVDLGALDDPTASAGDRMTALAASLDASERADTVWDELAGLVLNVLMMPANYDLGWAKGQVADRWVGQIRKDEPQPRGALMVLTGTMDYACAVSETMTGVSPVAGASIDLSVDVKGVTGGAVDPGKQGAEATQP